MEVGLGVSGKERGGVKGLYYLMTLTPSLMSGAAAIA